MGAFANPNQPYLDEPSPLLPPEQQSFVSLPNEPSQVAPPYEPAQYSQPQPLESQEPQMPLMEPQAMPPAGAYQDGPSDNAGNTDVGYPSVSR